MERLSVNTAIVGLLAVGARINETLWDLDAPGVGKPSGRGTNPGTSPVADETNLVVELATQEVKQCRSSLKLLHKTLCLLEAGQLPYPERARWLQVDHLIAILTDTALAFSDLQITCEMQLMQGSDAQSTFQSQGPMMMAAATSASQGQGQAQTQIHVPTYQSNVREQCTKRIRTLCSRIRWHNLSMAMLMTVLKCKADSDAQNSSRGLDQRMSRLLSSNIDLSGRMAILEDVFGAKPSAGGTPPYDGRLSPLSPGFGICAPSVGHDFYFSPASGSSTSNVLRNSTSSWSTFSHFTFADLSGTISAVALPLTTYDLRHGNAFYTVAYAREASHDSGDSNSLPDQHVKAPSEALAVPIEVPHPVKTGSDWAGFASKVRRLGRKRREKKQAAA